jgi:DNA-binding GntR family transcriptional regulator
MQSSTAGLETTIEPGDSPRSASPAARSRGETTAGRIREAILDGRLAPGVRLKEERLASELGISRTPVREALQLLRAEGLIDLQPNRGASVRLYRAQEVHELYGMRAVLEGHAARVAAEKITPETIERLEENCRRFDALHDVEDVRDLIRENGYFHNMILEAADVDRLTTMVRSVIELPLVYKAFLWYSPEQRRISAVYHRQILRALATHRPERAETAMREHVYEARDFLARHMRETEERLLEGSVPDFAAGALKGSG